MYYFIYLSQILKIYILIRYLHGAYVSYYFLKWILINTYSNFLWVLSFIHKPNIQLEDKYKNYKMVDGYLLII
jgi:hypothetical protein